MKTAALALLLAVGAAGPALAGDSATVPMHLIDPSGIGQAIGSVKVVETLDGVVLEPALTGLAPGGHGFHLHERGDCGPGEKDGKAQAGLAAGGHYDPDATHAHHGPQGEGHKGDLPLLEAGADGTASAILTSSRLKLADMKGRALVIHAGGDSYSDQPAPLGGGGARVACGVVP